MYFDQCCQRFVNKTTKNAFKFLQKRYIQQCITNNSINNQTTEKNGQRRRVVVTGIGCVSPVGCDTNAAWENILKGYCGIKKLTDSKYESLPCKIAAKIDENDLKLQEHFSKTELRSIATASQYALIAGSPEILSI